MGRFQHGRALLAVVVAAGAAMWAVLAGGCSSERVEGEHREVVAGATTPTQPAAGGAAGRLEWEPLGSLEGMKPLDIVASATPHGCHIAFAALKGDKQLVVVDGEPGPEFDGIGKDHPVFSPAGKRVAYAAQKGGKWRVVVDGKAGPEMDAIAAGPVFLRDGRLEYIARKDVVLYRVTERPAAR